MEFLLLGRVEAYDGNRRPIDLGRRRERCLLGVLLLHAGQAVSTARLVELLWDDDDLPRDPLAALRTCVSRLRTALQAGAGAAGEPRLATVAGGYRIELDPATVDAHRFRSLVDRARAEPDPADRAAVAAEALALWRGPLLADVATGTLRQRIGAELAELRLAATELYVDAELAQGRHHELIGRLHGLVAEHPTHEPFVDRLMLALHRAGRHTEALEAFQQLRVRLADELGTDPGPALQDRYRAILRHDPALAATGLPPARIDPVPRQLPADVAGFVGRADILKELDAALDHRLGGAVAISAVSGTAGVGKTALAVHWAHRVADRFPDGQLYVNLRGFDPGGRIMTPAEAVRGFLDAFGVVPGRIPSNPDAQVALYRSLLAGRRILVLLDNARDAEQVRPLLPGTPTALAVVTSRNQLTPLVAVDGARPVAVHMLSTEEAWELLAERLGAGRVALEPAAVERIIAACAQLPLALVVAAARARETRFSLAALAAELADAGQRLDTLDAGDPTSQIRTVFSWSCSALTPPAARLFRLLGLHPGPDIAVPAAASLAGHSHPDTRRLLTELARANLIVEHAPSRYAFHDLLRAYAGDLTRAHDPDDQRQAATVRMLDHYLHTAYAADRLLFPHREPIHLPVDPPARDSDPRLGGRREAMAWLAAEQQVLLTVLRQAYDAGFDTHAWQLTWSICTFLDRRGHWHDEIAANQTALEAARRLGNLAAQAYVHRVLGYGYTRVGYYVDSHIQLRRALDLYIRAGNTAGQAHSQINLAILSERQGHLEQALYHAQEALTLFQAVDHPRGQAKALNALGWYRALLGDHAEAVTRCQEALTLVQRLADRVGEAATRDSLGYAYRQLGRFAEAIDCYRCATTLLQLLGNRPEEATTLTNLGDTHHAAGDHDAARTVWQQALDILVDLDHPDAGAVRAKLDHLDNVD